MLHALRIARGEIAASSSDLAHGDVAPLGAAPESPPAIDAGDAALLLRGARGEDVDRDELDTDQEFAAGTSPFIADSDGDGVPDGVELAAGTSPTNPDSDGDTIGDGAEDPDADGLANAAEAALGTDPSLADTDGDGLLDGADAQPRNAHLYLFRDHLGSVVVVARDGGGIVRRSRYSAYGSTDLLAGATPPASGPQYAGTYGYAGMRFDQRTGLYDANARWYEPRLGRFLQADPIVPSPYDPQTLNRYSYVVNDPVSRIDPSGHEPVCYDVNQCAGSSSSVGVGSGGYHPSVFDDGPGAGDRGPGSLFGLVHPIQRGSGGSTRLTPQQWADQFWASMFARFEATASPSGGRETTLAGAGTWIPPESYRGRSVSVNAFTPVIGFGGQLGFADDGRFVARVRVGGASLVRTSLPSDLDKRAQGLVIAPLGFAEAGASIRVPRTPFALDIGLVSGEIGLAIREPARGVHGAAPLMDLRGFTLDGWTLGGFNVGASYGGEVVFIGRQRY